uniref:Clu domain-containing protein n=1 Tax=Ciona savignyi TaxID=51511 RepID=H2Y5E8_CIOSA
DQLISSVDCTPPECIMPGYKECVLTPMHPMLKEPKANFCLKVLTMSIWNPPPGNRKLHGDLLYLYAVTAEQKRFHITASSRGFYVNQSDMETFNPKPAQGAHVYHCLIDLLGHISPVFKRNFQALNKKRFGRHPYERIATPFQVHSWTAPAIEHKVDVVRAEDSYSSRLLFEEHIPGQALHYIFHTHAYDKVQKDDPLYNLRLESNPKRVMFSQKIINVHSDFVAAATRGAMMVIDGNVMAINPGDAKNMRMYIWNNIFFSLGFDVRDHYKNFGGNHAAFYAPCCDLNGVKAYSTLDTEGLYTLGTVVVDYRGRITAQSIIPGILEREQEHSVVYGSIDFGKTAQSNEKYIELLEKTTKQLHVQPHSILSGDKGPVKLCSSLECKGIIGNDQRHYILDLLRTFPPDLNYLPLEGEELSEECKRMGFPRQHRHRLSSLRPELVEVFIDHLYVVFMRHCASQIVNIRNKVGMEQKSIAEGESEGNGKKSKIFWILGWDVFVLGQGLSQNSCVLLWIEMNFPYSIQVKLQVQRRISPTLKIVMAKWQQEAVKSAATLVGSYSDTEFDVRFNPDIFSPDVKHDATPEELEKQKELLKQAARFIITNQIPTFVSLFLCKPYYQVTPIHFNPPSHLPQIKDCLEHTAMPTDGASLSDCLHERGINARYLGKIVKLIGTTPALQHVYRIGLMEIILRAAKHIMRGYLQNVDQCSVSSAVSHFLNCLLGSFPTPLPHLPEEELISNKRKKKARKQRAQSTSGGQRAAWHILTPEAVWEQIEAEASDYYDFKIGVKSVDELVEKHSVHKVALLRRLCITMGIQLLVKDYTFDSRHKPPFTEEDITNMYPVIKHAPPRASDAYQFYTSAQTKVQQGYLKEGYELFSEALNLFNNVYGAVHGEIAACYRHIARLNYMMGEHADAITNQQKAVILSERVLGIDNVTTIMDYISLALYCFANRKISAALKLLYRARYLFLCVHGNDHPEISLVNSNIGLVLHGVQEYDLSLRFLEEALKINIKYHGEKSLKAALSHHLVARAYSCKGEFRSALNHEKETYKLYKNQLGEVHEKTKESGECLKHLTEQAVTLQRTMNEIYKNGSTASIPPLQVKRQFSLEIFYKNPSNPPFLPQITAPSMHSVLDLMNVINGIIFIPLR